MNEGTFMFTAVLDDGCPPSQPTSLYTHVAEKGRAGAILAPDGCMHVIVESSGNEVAERFHCVSQPISVPANAPVEFHIAWKTPAPPKIRINDRFLKPLWESTDVCALSGLPVLHFAPPQALYSSLDTSRAIANHDRFFLETVVELDQRTHSLKDYDVLKASALLRLMLTDGLLTTINRQHRRKIRFRVARHPPPPFTDGLAYVQLDPTSGFVSAVDHVKLEQFLSTELLWHKGRAATVLDLVRLTANAMGGVHLGETESEHHDALRMISDQYVLPGQARNVVLSCLWSIARVTLVAVQELVVTIANDGDSSNRSK